MGIGLHKRIKYIKSYAAFFGIKILKIGLRPDDIDRLNNDPIEDELKGNLEIVEVEITSHRKGRDNTPRPDPRDSTRF